MERKRTKEKIKKQEPKIDESPAEFCGRIDNVENDYIIRVLYRHDLVRYTDEAKKWTDRGDEFVYGHLSIEDIKPRDNQASLLDL